MRWPGQRSFWRGLSRLEGDATSGISACSAAVPAVPSAANEGRLIVGLLACALSAGNARAGAGRMLLPGYAPHWVKPSLKAVASHQ